EMLSLAHELSHPLSQAWALNSAAWHYRFRREERAAHELGEAQVALCTEQGFAQLQAVGTIVRGWALAVQGQGAAGVAQMRHGLAAVQAMGAVIEWPLYLATLAEGYGGEGQAEAGLEVLAEAFAHINNTGVRFYEAEVYRLTGTLTLQQCKVQGSKVTVTTPHAEAEAEECLWKAIESARRQHAKSLELRAVMSLARLWQRQGKKKQAHQRLAQIYNWFTEGFDTADLQEAKTLLAELT